MISEALLHLSSVLGSVEPSTADAAMQVAFLLQDAATAFLSGSHPDSASALGGEPARCCSIHAGAWSGPRRTPGH